MSPPSPASPAPDRAAPAIEVERLSKRYGAVAAVAELDFIVRRRQTVALLGGNGAGKTTTIAMLLGLLEPTGGAIRVLGVDMPRRRHAALPRMNFSVALCRPAASADGAPEPAHLRPTSTA